MNTQKIYKLKRNRIECAYCHDVIESLYTHDFKFCKCGKVAIDGGLDYAKRSCRDPAKDYIDLSEWEEVME